MVEVGPVELSETLQAAHVEQAVELVDVGRLELELASEQLEDLAGHPRVDLEPDDPRVTAAAAQLGLDRREQVFGVAVDVVEVAVTRHPERVMADDLHPREERLQVQRDQVFERQVALAPLLRKIERDEAREHRRHLDSRESLLLLLRVAHEDREVQREVRDVRKRMAGVDRERGQHREDLLPEDAVQLGELLATHLLAAHQRDPGGGERRHHLLVEPDLPLDQALDPRPDRLQLFERRHSIGRGGRDRRQDLLFEACHAHLEEVVEVLAEDGEEAHPFEEGQLRILGHREHPFIEVEPRKLAVDVPGARGR